MAVKSRKRVPVKRLPKARQLTVRELDQTDRIKALEHNFDDLRDEVKVASGIFADAGKRLAQVEGSADYWAGVSQRVKTLEDAKAAPSTTIVEQASGMSIAWCFLIHDLILGGLIWGGWFYWHTFGFGFPPSLK